MPNNVKSYKKNWWKSSNGKIHCFCNGKSAPRGWKHGKLGKLKREFLKIFKYFATSRGAPSERAGSQCDKVTRIYTSLLVYTSIWRKILVFYSYFCDLLVFLWSGAHSTCCELFDPVKSYGNDSAILKQSKNMLLNFELHRSTCFLKTKTVLIYALLS